jgi:hypothetical protein
MFFTPQETTVDWARAIERNSIALKGIVEALFAMLAAMGEITEVLLPDRVYRRILRVLGPAESAVRRLVVIAARGLVVKPVPARPTPKGPIERGGDSRPRFKLFDPVKGFALASKIMAKRFLPRIHVFGGDPRVAALWAKPRFAVPAPPPDDRARTQRLVRRLQALKSALDDLPRQARRLARARARRENVPSLKFRSPLRPGPPPGHRKKKIHEIDEILAECHGLARDALKIDTS